MRRHPMKAAALGVALVLALAATASAQLPKPAHIVIVIEENKSPGDVTPGVAPYINGTLMPMGSSLGRFFAFHHPSQPNYIELFAGTNEVRTGEHHLPVCDDRCLEQPSTVDNLYTSISKKSGVTFAGYAEDLPPNLTS